MGCNLVYTLGDMTTPTDLKTDAGASQTEVTTNVALSSNFTVGDDQLPTSVEFAGVIANELDATDGTIAVEELADNIGVDTEVVADSLAQLDDRGIVHMNESVATEGVSTGDAVDKTELSDTLKVHLERRGESVEDVVYRDWLETECSEEIVALHGAFGGQSDAPERIVEALISADWEGLTFEALADQLGTSEKTARKHANRLADEGVLEIVRFISDPHKVAFSQDRENEITRADMAVVAHRVLEKYT